MIDLNEQQQTVVDEPGNVVVTACPGSGKTRVLTCRVLRELQDLRSSKHRVIAMTFTNRATDEIQERLAQLGASNERLWAGTIHAFALEWILRPYCCYLPLLRRGFSIADEFISDRKIKELKRNHRVPAHFEVNTSPDRNGVCANRDPIAQIIAESYKRSLREEKLLDYDDILYYAYYLAENNRNIARTVGEVCRVFCVDEIQDTQDLQYGIISAIFRASSDPPRLFAVGDSDQAIFESLGAVSKSPREIAQELALQQITHLELTGTYRSTQRIVELYQQLRPGRVPIKSLASHSEEHGHITFHNHTVSQDQVATLIGALIQKSLEGGVPAPEICVLAPHWRHVRSISRALIGLLPGIDFDSPGLHPFYSQRDNFWFKVARLFLTTPSAALFRTRLNWAREVIRDLTEVYGNALPETLLTSRSLLRLVNSLSPHKEDGLEFLAEAFSALAGALGINLTPGEPLTLSLDAFFEKAIDRIGEMEGEMPTDLDSFKRMFRHRSGVVISTCHSVKGEEYDTVIAFGLLRGYIPNWRDIMSESRATADERASKLLYVICSRAKKRLHLIAESSRFTRSGNQYEAATLLRSMNFDFDQDGR